MKDFFQTVHYQPTDAHQPGALVMLNRHYVKQDNSFYHWKKWLNIRDRWMRQQEEIHGKCNLTCSLCGRTGLNPWSKVNKKNTLATIDHILPVSRFPHLWNDPNNFQVACMKCNQGKRDKVHRHHLTTVKTVNNFSTAGPLTPSVVSPMVGSVNGVVGMSQ